MKSVIFILLIVFANCKNFENDLELREEYGLAFNNQRKEIGLPLLSQDWIIVNESLKIIIWTSNKLESKTPPYYDYKKVKFDSLKTITMEENRFVGPSNYENLEGKFSDELFITYSFLDNSWICVISDKYNAYGRNITREEADSILQIWNIQANLD